jgi:anti-anti-sigma factor
MPGATYEVIDGTFFVVGNLERSSDAEFQAALEKFAEMEGPKERRVDMSNVRWLTPSGAKVLIQVAQDIMDKGGSVRVVSSRHVQQTLNLLGARSWLTIESAAANPKPSVEAAAPASGGLAEPTDEELKMPSSVTLPATAPAAAAPAAASDAPAPTAEKPASKSSMMIAVPSRPGALASANEELSRGAVLFRALHADRRYNFLLSGGQEVTGIVRERLGGSWVVLETSGRKKILNLDSVQVMEML